MKNIRFSVGIKLMTAFAFFSIVIIISGLYLFSTMKVYKNEIEENKTKYNPSIQFLSKISSKLSKSNELILLWVYVEKSRNTNSKNTLDNIVGYKLPDLLQKTQIYTKLWSEEERNSFRQITQDISQLLTLQSDIMIQLENESDYSNSANLKLIKSKFGTNKEITELSLQTIEKIDLLTQDFKLKVSKRQNELLSLYEKTKVSLLVRSFLLLITAIAIAVLTSNRIIKPISKISRMVLEMSKGILKTEKILVQNDEIGDISKAINQLSKGLISTANFSKEIGSGNFTIDYKPLSSKDILGNSLLTTKENLLRTALLRKKNEEQERQRNWATSGIAKIGELLRENNNIDDFSYILIRELVKHLEANLGGFFLINELDKTDIYLELKASYAYEYKGKEERKIRLGETLIGQCFIERETIYVTKVPSNYLKISSGLGEEKPASVLIIPLIHEEKTFGVLELASFSEFEKYKIQFIEKISESIASTLANIKTNEHTEKLLEESQTLANQLSAQDEETRQIMEEMQATQEELDKNRKIELENEKKSKDKYISEIEELRSGMKSQIEVINKQKIQLQNTFNAIDHSLGTAHFTLSGKFIKVNSKFIKITGIKEEQLIGMKLTDFMEPKLVESPEFKKFWESLLNGNSEAGGHQYFYNKKEIWLYETFTPVKNAEDKFYKIIALCNDMSKVRALELKQKDEIKKLKFAYSDK